MPDEPGELNDRSVLAAAEAVFGAATEQALRYADLLVTDGIERGLIGPREAGRVWSRHLFNCVALAPLVADAARVVDLGSGAGLPGIPVALARPDLRITLLEPMARRAVFLTECVATLGLTRVEIRQARAQDGLPATDVVIARAVAALPALAPMALPGGSKAELLALKGSTVVAEADELTAAGGYDVDVVEVMDPVGSPATVARVRRSR